MKLENEREETVYKFDVDFTDNEADVLVDIGLKRIKNDREALINYAVNALLKEYVENIKKEEGVKDGESNSWR